MNIKNGEKIEEYINDRFNLFLDKKIGQLKNKRKKKNENRRHIK